MKTIRCAIYTRKSSDEGLEQGFNSLDAQREACAAYILSQASEGWSALPDIYDDGGISGGTLERPALQRLLADVAAGRIDIIVVYKVDRLTRSLLDFSKLVEAFDKADTSFVSITQSFNTTTSMGRLTLNMLLSFAQFEREVTAERIRDKIAASKAKGMWMGGTPPLGYRPDGRTLAIVEEQAALVREIFALYVQLGNVRLVAGQLLRQGGRSPIRARANGVTFGDRPFTRGQLYAMLKNPIYVGEIAHGAKRYPGLHPGIVDRETWDGVQAMLANNVQGGRRSRSAATESLLAGLIVDGAGDPLVAAHACKGKTRYRYYVSRPLHHNANQANGIRLPAREIESAVIERLAEALSDPFALTAAAGLTMAAADLLQLHERSNLAIARLRSGDRAAIIALVERVRILAEGVDISLRTAALAELLQLPLGDAAGTFSLTSNIRVTRTGRAVRLVQTSGAKVGAPSPNQTLVNLLVKAHQWWAEVRRGQITMAELAQREGVIKSYVSRVVRLTFLAPEVVEAILAGRQLASIDGRALKATDAIPMSWLDQRTRFLPQR
ncbi:MAG: recombinase family protein [Pseudomonadota bacterium]